MAIPGLAYFFIFKYIPLAGNIIAFQNYNLFQGFTHSKWVGLHHFLTLFQYDDFWIILRNSLKLGLYSILFGFPAPLVLAILLNEMRAMWLKRPLQTMLYLPHFLSWVIVGGIFSNLLDAKGWMNQMLHYFNFGPFDFLGNSSTFLGTIISISIWKEIGWGTIIYLAALAGINPSLYEAATVDGANRLRQIWSITMPSLMPAIIVLLLLRVGNLLDANIEQMLMFLNPLVRDVGEVFDTYIYRVGLLDSQYSYSTAIGVFKSVIGLILLTLVNTLSKKTTGESVY
ncbi:ABC transporter permease subunit [Paenibacillus qinlingensis]|uniref:Aldouronate transport system permease protein n=1 Tax=Paenibacillus qinlingensis TaxID=1837343 RepID=A0ABU1NU19_9BACL|nr:ABC transporter permease subunit [Paenibacillus qinlingensis]MDR6550977.1 putative aldouronate transport system permease protein [Paenibacillus qinlingensis]